MCKSVVNLMVEETGTENIKAQKGSGKTATKSKLFIVFWVSLNLLITQKLCVELNGQ